ncbi:MAG TPA: rhomboid family intramembrane serine protease, partial [Longimicrobiales bacterium]|nr:rhomboid family intramembrane serine protease [Longimicrobiales bacterium]
VLFFFGPPLEARWGGREFFRFYVVSGLGGVALSFILAPGDAIIGASAACYGLMLAFAMNWPKAPIYIYAIFPVQARYLVGFLFLLNVWSGFADPNGGVAYFAHLGGLVAAFLYLKADWRPNHFARKVSERARPRPRKLVVVPREDRDERPAASASPMADPEERKMLDEVDRVLDKISAQGMSSLTAEERRLLDEVSRRRRTH